MFTTCLATAPTRLEKVVSLRSRYCAAQSFGSFVQNSRENSDLWQALARRARVSPDNVERLQAVRGRWHILVLAEDWCGDAVNTLPVFAALAERASNVDLRVLSRDDNPDLMDTHLSIRGARAIPVVMVLDGDYVERAWWGSRPDELQRWVDTVGRGLSKEDRYREIRRWYVRDGGESAVGELIALIEGAAREPLVA